MVNTTYPASSTILLSDISLFDDNILVVEFLQGFSIDEIISIFYFQCQFCVLISFLPDNDFCLFAFSQTSDFGAGGGGGAAGDAVAKLKPVARQTELNDAAW